LDNFQHTGPSKTLERFCMQVLAASLCQIQCEAKRIDNVCGHSQQILL